MSLRVRHWFRGDTSRGLSALFSSPVLCWSPGPSGTVNPQRPDEAEFDFNPSPKKCSTIYARNGCFITRSVWNVQPTPAFPHAQEENAGTLHYRSGLQFNKPANFNEVH